MRWWGRQNCSIASCAETVTLGRAKGEGRTVPLLLVTLGWAISMRTPIQPSLYERKFRIRRFPSEDRFPELTFYELSGCRMSQRQGHSRQRTKTAPRVTMSVFSFTAPQFTPEMADAERSALSEEERSKLRAEAYGEDGVEVEETPEMVQDALEQFKEHLLQLEPKDVYNQALERCPWIVQTESAPISFLRAERFNAEVSIAVNVAGSQCSQALIG